MARKQPITKKTSRRRAATSSSQTSRRPSKKSSSKTSHAHPFFTKDPLLVFAAKQLAATLPNFSTTHLRKTAQPIANTTNRASKKVAAILNTYWSTTKKKTKRYRAKFKRQSAEKSIVIRKRSGDIFSQSQGYLDSISQWSTKQRQQTLASLASIKKWLQTTTSPLAGILFTTRATKKKTKKGKQRSRTSKLRLSPLAVALHKFSSTLKPTARLAKLKHHWPKLQLPQLPRLPQRLRVTISEVMNELRAIVLLPASGKVKKTTAKASKASKRSRRKLPLWKKTWRSLLTTVDVFATSIFEHRIALVSIFLIVAGIAGATWSGYMYVFDGLPEPQEIVTRQQNVTTRILDRNGEVLFRLYKDENRTLIALSELPVHVTQATIAIEDQSFYDHVGFSIPGITRAFIGNIQGESVQGGSTITQQLVKNRLLTPERTIRRKIREVVLAISVDATYTKDEILEMYLNQVAYGGATYGIEEAAQNYFGKSARELTLAESSMLAGLPAAPSVYSPFGTHPELAYNRQAEVLRRMVEDGYITQDEANQARSQELAFRPNTIDIQAPHFVMYVRELLATQFGEEALQQAGFEVTTTLDLELQNLVQEKVTDEVDKLQNLRVSNGAALVTRPSSGEILSMVGSKDYFDFEHDGQVNVTLRPRQPGSSIKPLTYATALEKGKTPSTIIDDAPITFTDPWGKSYSPKNYDGRYHGRVTLKSALANSYNIPAVKLLADIGVSTLIDKAQQLGISTWTERTRFGLSLTLGGGEVLMTDMAQAYGTFANNGRTVPLNPILEIKDSHGQVVYRNECAQGGYNCPSTRTFDPRVAYQINEILSDNAARTPAFGSHSVLAIPDQQVAVKTGTTNNLRDNWTIGYTSDILVATWVGNNDNTPMSYVASGITGASPIWNNIIRLTLDEENPHAFGAPSGMIKVAICPYTGTLTCSGCPRTVEEYFVPGTEPKRACNPAYFQPKEDPENPGQPDGSTANNQTSRFSSPTRL